MLLKSGTVFQKMWDWPQLWQCLNPGEKQFLAVHMTTESILFALFAFKIIVFYVLWNDFICLLVIVCSCKALWIVLSTNCALQLNLPCLALSPAAPSHLWLLPLPGLLSPAAPPPLQQLPLLALIWPAAPHLHVQGVCPRLLKDCAGQLAVPPQRLFNISLQMEKVPVLWKTSCLFLTTALTSHMMKTFEQLLFRRMRLQVAEDLDPSSLPTRNT